MVALNPVGHRNIGSPISELPDDLWRPLYEFFGLRSTVTDQPLRTMVSGETIGPYLDIGWVFCGTNRGLFGRTRAASIALLDHQWYRDILDGGGLRRVFLHQAVFACAVLATYHRTEITALPSAVNYPLHRCPPHSNPPAAESLVSIRYDDHFEKHLVPSDFPALFSIHKDRLAGPWYYD